jgi:hypothetical protein
MRLQTGILAAAAAVLLTGSLASAAVLPITVPDGNFENGTTGWDGFAGTLVADNGPSEPGSSAITASNMAWGALIYENNGALVGTPGAIYTLSFDVKATDVVDSGYMVVNVDMADGAHLVSATCTQNTAPLSDGQWHTVTAPFTMDAAGTARIEIDCANTGSSASMSFDNIQILSSVPEPSCMALLGLGSMAVLRRKRSR